MSDNNKKFAVLIDSDNSSHNYLKTVFDELAKYGTATYRRAYGDWTQSANQNWKNDLLNFSITPMQQYAYTTGKNSTDSAMIIDAMDILYGDNVDGFCLVSSDSDFTKLAMRLREAGKEVIGMGRQQTPKSFTNACSRFVFLDVIGMQTENAQSEDKKTDEGKKSSAKRSQKQSASKTPAANESDKSKKSTRSKAQGKADGSKADGAKAPSSKGEAAPEALKAEAETDRSPAQSADNNIPDKKTMKKVIESIINDNSDDEGWIAAAFLGTVISRNYPAFDCRNYNFPKFKSLLKDWGFVVEERESNGSKVLYVKNKN